MNLDDWVYVVGTRSDDYRWPSIKGLIGKVIGKDITFPGQWVVKFFTNKPKELGLGWIAFTESIYPEDVRLATNSEVNDLLMRMSIENGELPKASPYFKMKMEIGKFLDITRKFGRYEKRKNMHMRSQAKHSRI